MKKNKTILTFFILAITSSFSFASDITSHISKYDWDGIEVTWLEDERLPLYKVLIYFADGALSDGENERGATNAMFEMLDSGTRRYGQMEINENLEFFGVSWNSTVNHEYSFYTVSGLVKDIVPTMKQVCHLFQEATFPEDELKKEIKKAESEIESMVNNQGGLATHIFREVSLSGTPYSYPVTGKLKDLRKITSKVLENKLKYFNQKVKKRIYIAGPKKALQIKSIVNQECGWSGKGADYVRVVPIKNNSPKNQVAPRVVFVPVPNSNQAQVRIGRFLNKTEIAQEELLELMSNFLGGGFTSMLMRAVRFNEGLTYSIGAFAAGQRDYGRAAISTSTKNQSLQKLIDVIRNTLETVQKGQFSDGDFERMKGNLIGSYHFALERKDALVSHLSLLDHKEKNYSTLENFNNVVSKFGAGDVSRMDGIVFDWSKQTIFVLGSPDLKKDLQKMGSVEVLNFKDFL